MEIKDVENLAELAKIELTDIEKQNLLKDMEEILGYVKQVQRVETKDIETNYLNKNVWREDLPASSVFSKDLIIDQFPDSKDGFVKVKKIL
jgi:aspartyl-tRNA(Asn)/glutamyl-tRNA(Gln) amidotransferase subunit C